MVRFSSRYDAGRRLGQRLALATDTRPIVVALSRGGVPVAYEVALALDAALDVLVVHKVPDPAAPERALGVLVEGDELDGWLAEHGRDAPVSAQCLRDAAARHLAEIERRHLRYRGGRPRLDLTGRTVVLVDDRIATGATATAALRVLRRTARPARLEVAVPAATRSVAERLRRQVDAWTSLALPARAPRTADLFEDGREITDDEIVRLLDAAQRRMAREAAVTRPHAHRVAAGAGG